jgi:rhodanese-related sulfurtransferase
MKPIREMDGEVMNRTVQTLLVACAAAAVAASLAACAGESAPAAAPAMGAAAAVQPAAFSRPAPLPRDIPVADAAARRDQGAFILDVREPDEWNEFHIPGATLIPLGELGARMSEVPKDREIVVICRSGNRSQRGRDILLDAGFSSVTSVSGGMNQWRSAGHPTVSGP